MSAKWFVNGPSGKMEVSESEMQEIQRGRMSSEEVLAARKQKPTPPPPRFTEPSMRAPNMRISQR